MKLRTCIVTTFLAGVSLSGCATDKYYSPVVQHSPPQRWSDPVTVCVREPTIVSDLRISLRGVYIPERQDVPCSPQAQDIGFREGDDGFVGEGKVDPSGFGQYAMSLYTLEIDNPASRLRGDGLASERVMPVLNKAAGVTPSGDGARFWRHHEEIYSRDEHINGRVWKHYAFTRYDSRSEDPTKPGSFRTWGSVDVAEPVNNAPAVFDITEVYILKIDEGHAILATGRYKRMVIEDPGWYASRKALLERMVRSLDLTDVTDIEVERARAAAKLRRAADKSRK
ncbi:hypothetical protein FIV34_19410 [Luteibacter pinisoli]|uniref:Lipoprotein n=1 Tax=Luteibacter pinisoli TaxID=2589080 RepID=A0A4Y5ZAR6_9GAMM|nr:hypothetical protein [Luteibacter pinisoli]QDE41213.1 hypothetical protein FIV34_19410 [Luteibacter pinisoli]